MVVLTPTLIGKIASVATALILIPTTTFFIHRYVKQGKPEMQNKALVEGSYRLPQDLKPIRYELNIKAMLPTKSFMGYVRIEIECKKPTKTVVLHARQLILLSDIKFYKNDGKKKIKVRDIHYSNEPVENPNDLLILDLSEELKPNNKYHFEVDFGGRISPSFHQAGFYLSKDHNQKAKDVATTCFFPAGARTAFPCFDEPSLKAHFTIKLCSDGGVQTVSNMPPSGTSRDTKGNLWQEFEMTPQISPHQVGFVIGELSSRTDSTSDGKQVLRTWALPGNIGKVAYIRSIGLDLIEFYNKFFDVPYPLRVLNLVVLPETKEKVRENFGLITLSESQLLTESDASLSAKYRAALVFSQKLAHQWMGCLATMKWWSDYWVIDSFDLFVRSIAVKKHFSELDAFRTDLGKFLVRVLLSDDEDKVSPVSIPNFENLPAEKLIPKTGNYEDNIDVTVNKGALVFRMLYNTLGEDLFKAGVSAYVKKHVMVSFPVSEQDDLWAALNEVAQSKQVLPSGVTVKQIVEKWTMQAGYPVIEVTKRNGGDITITQKRYLSKASSKTEVAQQCWWVPVTFQIASKPGTTSTQWLGCDPNSLTIKTGAGAGDWIIMNRDNGIFRVNYDSQTWEQLASALKGDRSRINEIDRMLLVSDAMALANSGHINYKIAFKVLSSVSQEEHYLPWYSALKHLEELEDMVDRTDKFDSFKKMVKKLLGNIYSELKKGRSGIDDDKLLPLVKDWACKYDVGDCAEGLMQQFTKWRSNPETPINKDVVIDVFCMGLKQGGEDEFNYVLQHFQKMSAGKTLVLMALTCTTHQESLNKLLNLLLDSNVAPAMYGTVAYLHAFKNRAAYPVILNFVLNNFEKVKNHFSGSHVFMIFNMFGKRAALQDDIDKLKHFASTNQEMAAELDNILEEAEQRVAWVKNNLDSISTGMDAF